MKKGWLIASTVAGILSLFAPIVATIADSKVAEEQEKELEARVTANVLKSIQEAK